MYVYIYILCINTHLYLSLFKEVCINYPNNILIFADIFNKEHQYSLIIYYICIANF